MYYTPEMEEFHIGFQYEMTNSYQNGWNKYIFGKEESIPAFKRPQWVTFLDEILENKLIRVKCLDHADIISLDWELTDYMDTFSFRTKDALYFLEFGGEKSFIELQKASGRNQDIFAGEIKNISQLRVIMKQLGISKDEK